MTTVVAAGFGMAVGVGLLLVVLGALGVALGPRSTGPGHARSLSPERVSLRAGLGLVGAIVMLLLTGWPVAVILGGLALAAAPSLVGAKAARAAAVARTEAIAAWAEMLRDTMAAAAGLEEAIASTARVAPPAIRPEVQRLAARIERGSLDAALAEFADALEDPVADMVAASILLTSRRQARRVGDLLGAVSSSARANASMRLKIEATRARTYTSVRLVVLITLAFAGSLVVFSRDYLAPFDDAAGQAVLLLIGCTFGVAYLSMVKMAEVGGPARLLSRLGDEVRR